MTYLILILTTLLLLWLLSVSFKKEIHKTKQVNLKIIEDAKTKGLNPIKLFTPNSDEWSDCPFEIKVRIGKYAHFGIPSNREYYRIVEVSKDNIKSREKWWVKVVYTYKTEISVEWKK